ncbi:MAG: glycosyltransferase family 2 protein [Firmicutes bacterium]|nr:glycosyltransferase family 2 protein [Bacillota bacterium]NBI64449.1 glycosyltransferase family 2 protein [Clostridiales bacterium]
MVRKELLIIIPAHNEEENIPRVLEQLAQPEIAKMADVLVIDDASTDLTGRIVKTYHYHLVTQVFNMGYGSALQVGYKYAVQNHYQYVIQMDADGQHDPCDIPAIYQKLKEKTDGEESPNIVLASRFMEGSAPFPVSVSKKIAYKFFRFLIYILTGKRIYDPTTGMQGLDRSAFCYYSKSDHFDDKYPDANMILQMILLGFQVTQIPAVMHTRTVGQSMHSGLKPIWYMFRMFFSMMVVLFRIKVLKFDREGRESHVE